MTEERRRWAQVKAIFDAALPLEPDRRTAFLREACGADAALAADVSSLLAAHAAAGSFADRPAIDALPAPVLAVADEPALLTGAELGVYRIVGPLDAGGMGEVYRARDTRLHRDVAVKVLPAALSDDPARVARLEREARLLAAVNHPGIATIHGLEIAGGRHAIVMELVEGPTLQERLAAGPLPIGVALDCARQIAEALETAHDRGIVHRDLKPANVKLTAAGTVKVLDFGLATEPAGAGDHAVPGRGAGAGPSRDGLVAGTPGYMSPEQARGDRVDARSDVWGFGCLLFEMLAGGPAFDGIPVGETDGAATVPEVDWDRLPANTPPGIRRLLRRCLAPEPRRRLHHIADARLEVDDAIEHPERESPPAPTPTGRAARIGPLAIAAVAVAVAALFGLLAVRQQTTTPDLRVVEITTPRTSDLWSFALSPDGRQLAFVADHDGRPVLWVRALDSAEARVLPGTDGARRPFWSPDSRSIGFFRNSELKRVDARGGSPQTISYALAGTAGTWGPDGTILFSSTVTPALQRVDARGGTVTAVTTPGADSTGHRHPQFLPGGRDFLFFAGGPAAVRGVYLGSLGSPRITRLVASDAQGAYVAPGWLVFIRQGTLWAQAADLAQRRVSGEPVAVADAVAFEPVEGSGAFSASNAGAMAYRTGRNATTLLSWFDRTGRPIGTLGAPEQTGLTNVRLSPDGQRVAAERSVENDTDVWLLDATRQTRFTHGSPGTLSRLPVWSPDGRRIAFESVRSGSVAIALKPADGDGPEEVLVASPEVKIPSDWSPDGRFLAYYVPNPKTGTDLWVLPLETRRPAVFLGTDANELWGQFSPDGHWMAYQSNESGRYEIYVRPFPARGGPTTISSGGGVYPRWSRDGKALYFVAPDAALMAVAIRSTPAALEAGPPARLFQTRRLGGGSNVIGRSHQYDVTRDGRFLINVDADGAPPITLLLGWKP